MAARRRSWQRFSRAQRWHLQDTPAPLRHALFILIAALLLSACAGVRAQEIRRIALFAPFEGRYREIGYDALYAARLAFSDSPNAPIELLAVDSGGTQAESHARALAQDPLVMAVIALGYDATAPEVLRALGDLPVLVVGEWGAEPISENIFIFSNPEIAQQITTPARVSVTDAAALPAPVVGTDVFALEGLRELRESLNGVTILSSGWLSLPGDGTRFTERYKNDDPFAPEPGLLAALTYNATTMATFSASGSESRTHMQSNLAPDFPNGYWKDAQIQRYVYVDGRLTESVEPQS